MWKVIKRKLCVIIAVCILVGMVVSKPIMSKAEKATGVEGAVSTIEITDVDKEFLEDDATSAVNSDASISVDVLEDTLSTADVVDVDSSTELLKYLYDLSSTAINQSNLFRPSKVDNSKSKYFPTVIDQGSLNSCTTWSTVYYQMSYAVNKELDRDASVEGNVFSPTWIYNMANDGENKGNYYSDILKILSEIGAVPMTMVPAVITDEGDNVRNVMANRDLWLEASKYRVKEYYNIDMKEKEVKTLVESPDDVDLDAIKKALAVGEVLTATTYAYKWNRAQIVANKRVPENKKYAGEYIVTDCTSKSKGAHRITIVGYNDKIWVDINKNGKVEKGEKGAFKIANSYGTNKDNNGFIWMSYDAINLKSCMAPENEAVNPDRSAGIFDIIGFNVDLDSADDECYAVLDVQTTDLKSLNVKITATDNTGKKVTYEPAPFTNAMTRGMGEYPFNSGVNGDKGEFYIDLGNVVEGLTKAKFSNYDWDFEIVDASEEKEMTINSLKIYTKTTDSMTRSYIKEPVTINFNTLNVKISMEETSAMALGQWL